MSPENIGAAYASDHLFRARRFPVAALMMLSLSAACIVTSYLTVVAAAWQIALILALLGCATYGTDTLLAGAATQDSANTEDIGTIAGAATERARPARYCRLFSSPLSHNTGVGPRCFAISHSRRSYARCCSR